MSTTLCRNSRARRGSISEDDVIMKRRLACLRLKRRVGGFVFGRYIKDGRGAGWARYRGRMFWAERGREVYMCVRIGLLARARQS
jgi:hypothetical protein